MKDQRINAIARFIPVGLISILFSCKMELEETTTESAAPDTHIRLSDSQIQLANINITEAREGSIGQKLSLYGVLKVNEQSAFTISTRLTGRIEKLYFRNTGETIKKGDKLYEFYSDDLIDAQREYYALQSNNWNYSGKYEPSLILKDKLLIMGLLESQIKQLEKDGKVLFRVTIYSPSGGKIRAINVTEGQYVTEGQSLFELADDNNLWVEAQVYPDEVQCFSQGMPAIAVIPSAGEVPVLCNISFIKPSFEANRNVTIIRTVINNPENRLHPGMLALLYVQTKIRHGIIIPSSAVLTGSEGDRVWVRDGNGDFSGRMVTTGTQSEDSILVLSGLEKSDKIVYTGAYLLNSEFILRNGTGVSNVELPEFKIGKVER
jgi:membrane fusion protein, copper/silver efflux system